LHVLSFCMLRNISITTLFSQLIRSFVKLLFVSTYSEIIDRLFRSDEQKFYFAKLFCLMLQQCQWFCTHMLFLCPSSETVHYMACTHTHTRPFNVPLSGTTWISRYEKGKTNLDFTEARDSEWQWHQLFISWAICKSVPCCRQITMPAPHHSVFLQAGCPSCHPTNSVKALKAKF